MREPAHRPGHHPRPITRPTGSHAAFGRHDAPAAPAKLVAIVFLVLQCQAQRPRRRPHPVRQPTREVVQKSRTQSRFAPPPSALHHMRGFQAAFDERMPCTNTASRMMVRLERLSRASPEAASARPPLYMPWPWCFANHGSHRHLVQ